MLKKREKHKKFDLFTTFYGREAMRSCVENDVKHID